LRHREFIAIGAEPPHRRMYGALDSGAASTDANAFLDGHPFAPCNLAMPKTMAFLKANNLL
jgi:hypothetical protein